MPSISDMLKLNSGQLGTTSLQEAQALTGQQAPTSPAQASSIGADPDAAKMAGSSAQKIPALREAIQGQSDLATRQREQQSITQATSDQSKEISGANDAAQGLGDLQSRVQALATQQLQQGVQAATAQGLSTTGITDPAMQAIATKLKANPTDMSALADLGTKLGRTPTQDDITALVGGAAGLAGAAGSSVAANTANNLSISQLDPSIATTASKLLNGMDVSKMTVQQLSDAINQEVQAEYSNTSNLQSKLSDPSIGPAERAEARQQLKDMGAVGVTAAESTIDKLADKIETADTVTFNGQPIKVDSLLSSDYVAGLVSNYITDPNSADSQTLAKNEPDLVKFINDYKPVLQAAVQSLGSGIPQFAAIQQKNQALAKVDLGNGQQITLPDAVMQAIYPKWGQMSGESFNPAASPLLQYMSNNNPSITVTDKQGLNSILTSNPELATGIAGLSDAQLRQSFSGSGLVNTQANLAQAQAAANLDPAHPYPDAVASIYGFTSQQDMQGQIQTAYSNALAHGTASDYLNGLKNQGIQAVPGANGQLNVDFNSTQANVKNLSKSDLSSIMNNNAVSGLSANQIRGPVSSMSPVDKAVAKAAPDGLISTTDELNQVGTALLPTLAIGKPADFTQLNQFMTTPAYKNMPTTLKAALNQKVATQASSEVNNALTAAFPDLGKSGVSGILNYSVTTPANPATLSKLKTELDQVTSELNNPANTVAKDAYTSLRSTLQTAYNNLNKRVQTAPSTAPINIAGSVPTVTDNLGSGKHVSDPTQGANSLFGAVNGEGTVNKSLPGAAAQLGALPALAQVAPAKKIANSIQSSLKKYF